MQKDEMLRQGLELGATTREAMVTRTEYFGTFFCWRFSERMRSGEREREVEMGLSG